jgi:hypothetical protein
MLLLRVATTTLRLEFNEPGLKTRLKNFRARLRISKSFGGNSSEEILPPFPNNWAAIVG